MILHQLTRKHVLTMFFFGVLITLVVLTFYATSGVTSEPAQHACGKSEVDTSNSTLELVHIVFRHGARTPVDTYPNDPYLKGGFYPTGWGHVTNKGKRDLYQLGSWLNHRYRGFLDSYYSPDSVHAQSTASPRAYMSLATVLASLFPPNGTPMEWSKRLNWQPIPIFSEPLDQDSLLLVRTPCPRYFEARDEVLQRPEVRAELSKHEELFRNLTELTGMRVASADAVNSLYITLQAESELGLPLPAWTKDYYPERMQFLAEQSYIYNAYTPEMQKIKGGPFLKRMFAEMLEKRSQTLRPHRRKMYIYTGHDWTVGSILTALNVWKRQMPLFSVMAIFELHRNRETGEYYVEVFLRNDPRGCLTQLKVPGCDRQCPLDKLLQLSSAVLPNEPYEERCRARNTNYEEPPLRAIDANDGERD